MFLTRAAYDTYVAVPPGGQCGSHQDEAGRLWDIVWMLRCAIQHGEPGQDRLPVALYVCNTDGPAKLVQLVAQCGPRDIEDPAPAITVLLPDED